MDFQEILMAAGAFIVVTGVLTLWNMRRIAQEWTGVITKTSFSAGDENSEDEFVVHYRKDGGGRGKMRVNKYYYDRGDYAGWVAGARIVKPKGSEWPDLAQGSNVPSGW